MRFGLVMLLGVGLASCGGGGSSGSSSNGPPADPYPDCGPKGKYVLDDPALTPGGFDEGACRVFMRDGIPKITTDATKAPEFKTPLAGALLPATPDAKFTWTAGMLSMREWPTLWQQIKESLVLERTAYAAPEGGAGDAGSTFTSDAYVIIFNGAMADAEGGIPEILRVMTINTNFTPTDAQWAALQAAGSIVATVYGMHFDTGSIISGPFASQPRAFSVAAM